MNRYDFKQTNIIEKYVENDGEVLILRCVKVENVQNNTVFFYVCYDTNKNRPRIFLKGKSSYEELEYRVYEKYNVLRRFTIKVSWLIIVAYKGSFPKNKICNHKNENTTDDNPKNLYYITQSENVKHGTSRSRSALHIRLSGVFFDTYLDENIRFSNRIEYVETYKKLCCPLTNEFNYFRYQIIFDREPLNSLAIAQIVLCNSALCCSFMLSIIYTSFICENQY